MSEKSEVQGLRLRIALVVLAALALGYGGFELGRSSAGYFVVNSMLERLELRKRNHALDEENKALEMMPCYVTQFTQDEIADDRKSKLEDRSNTSYFRRLSVSRGLRSRF